MRFMTQYVRLVNGGAGGGRAHRLTHKIVKRWQSLKCHHVKGLRGHNWMLLDHRP